MIEFGRFRLDTTRKVLWCEGESVQVPPKELEILCLLVENAGELVTKNEIIDTVWANSFVEESNITRRIYLLRNLLRKYGAIDDLIENVPTRGYRFNGRVGEMRSDQGAVVIERHTLTETLIEELENTDDQSRALAAPSTGRYRFWRTIISYRLRLAAVVALFSIVAAGFAYMSFAKARSAGSSGIRSVAVLPFRSAGENVDDQAGLGLADLLITRLSNIRDISVRPTSAVFSYSQSDAAEFGRGLDVDAVVEGTVYRTNETVRVTVRLVKVADRSSIWAGQFERPLNDELRVQDEIALQVANALSNNITGDEKAALTKRYTENSDAYQTYLRGRYSWNRRSNQDLAEAERQFRNAIETDPKFALAYVGLADTTGMRSDAAEAYTAVRRALELDPGLAEGHATLGFLQTFHEWNWKDAESSFRRSIELNPGYATAHHWYATLLSIEGRFDEAKSEMNRALEIDPGSHNFLADLGQIHYFAGEYEKAEEYCRRALKIYPEFGFAHYYLAENYLKQGRNSEAVDEFLMADAIQFHFDADKGGTSDQSRKFILDGRSAFRNGGLAGFAAWRLSAKGIDGSSEVGFAISRLMLGQKGKALEHLEKAHRNGAFMMSFVKADPIYDDLRQEPGYKKILDEMGLGEVR